MGYACVSGLRPAQELLQLISCRSTIRIASGQGCDTSLPHLLPHYQCQHSRDRPQHCFCMAQRESTGSPCQFESQCQLCRSWQLRRYRRQLRLDQLHSHSPQVPVDPTTGPPCQRSLFQQRCCHDARLLSDSTRHSLPTRRIASKVAETL